MPECAGGAGWFGYRWPLVAVLVGSSGPRRARAAARGPPPPPQVPQGPPPGRGGACCAVRRAGGGGVWGKGRAASSAALAVGAREGTCGCARSTCGGLLTASAIRRRTSASVRGGRSAHGGASLAGSVSCRPSPRASCRACTVRPHTTPWLTQWTAAGRRPGGGATVPRAALTTAHAASACA